MLLAKPPQFSPGQEPRTPTPWHHLIDQLQSQAGIAVPGTTGHHPHRDRRNSVQPSAQVGHLAFAPDSRYTAGRSTEHISLARLVGVGSRIDAAGETSVLGQPQMRQIGKDGIPVAANLDDDVAGPVAAAVRTIFAVPERGCVPECLQPFDRILPRVPTVAARGFEH